MTDADIEVLSSYSLIHVSTKNRETVKRWHTQAPGVPAVKYTETVPVR